MISINYDGPESRCYIPSFDEIGPQIFFYLFFLLLLFFFIYFYIFFYFFFFLFIYFFFFILFFIFFFFTKYGRGGHLGRVTWVLLSSRGCSMEMSL